MRIERNAGAASGADLEARLAPSATRGARWRDAAVARPTPGAQEAPRLSGADDGESEVHELSAAGEGRAALPEFPLQELSIRMHPELDQVIVQVIDSRTREVIRQIPPEEWVRVLEQLHGRRGVLFDRQG